MSRLHRQTLPAAANLSEGEIGALERAGEGKQANDVTATTGHSVGKKYGCREGSQPLVIALELESSAELFSFPRYLLF